MKDLHAGDLVQVGYLRLLIVKMGSVGFNLLDMDDYALVNEHTVESPKTALEEFCDNNGVNIQKIKINPDNNPFTRYTDWLASILYKKNQDYGNSFDKSLDQFGIIAGVVRLEDKFNRLANLTSTNKSNLVKNESLADTALDLAGYGILLYKYLAEHEKWI